MANFGTWIFLELRAKSSGVWPSKAKTVGHV